MNRHLYLPISDGNPESEIRVAYRYGFNGKDRESEFSSGAYDFGARIHDARLGRFFVPDPDERKYPSQSTFVTSGNNPIRLIDLFGKGPDDPQEDSEECSDSENSECSSNSNQTVSDPAKLSFSYFGLDRTQIGGNVDIKLNLDFNYIQPFSGDSRFAPDEPSSFSSIEFTFGDNNSNLDLSVGLFRNHEKGDILLGGGNDVHFDKGNSQVGIGIGVDAASPEFFGCTTSAKLFVGVGPQFTDLNSDGNSMSTNCWGSKGFGQVAMVSWNIINTPPLFGVVSVSWSMNATVHHCSFSNFDVTNGNTGDTTTYSNVNFTTAGFANTLTLNFHWRGRR